MKAQLLATKKIDMAAVRQALDDMRRACGGGDIPAKLVRSTARLLEMTPVEFAEAAARLNRPSQPATCASPRIPRSPGRVTRPA